MLRDRLSAYEALGLSLADALQAELARGVGALEQAREGARRFAAGEGRHGA
jgi:hypothetical protein